jgi:hypothetical protein
MPTAAMTEYLLAAPVKAVWFVAVGIYVLTVTWVILALTYAKYVGYLLLVVLAITIPIGLLSMLPPAILIAGFFGIGVLLARPTARFIERVLNDEHKETA